MEEENWDPQKATENIRQMGEEGRKQFKEQVKRLKALVVEGDKLIEEVKKRNSFPPYPL